MICASCPDTVMLTRTSGLELVRAELVKAGFRSPVEAVSVQVRRALVGKISGCYDPIVTSDFFRLSYELKIRYAGSLARTFLKRLLDRCKTCNPVFRPSTGIISLLMAIDEHGADCEYVVAGIGMKNRSIYIHTERSTAQGASVATLPQHVFADRKILMALSSRYRITTTEPELMEILPPFSDG